MPLMQNIKNYLINFSGISWNKNTNRYDLTLDPTEGNRGVFDNNKNIYDTNGSNPTPSSSSSNIPNKSNSNNEMPIQPNSTKPESQKQQKPEPKKSEPMVFRKDIKTAPDKKDENEFDYTYGGLAKFNTRDLLNENEAYRDTVYTNYFKDSNGKWRYDVPTIGYGQTLRHALGDDEIELVDQYGNKKTQTGKEWDKELSKKIKELPQGSGNRKGRRYDSDDDPIQWKISKESQDRLTQKVNAKYLQDAIKVCNDYAKKYGDQFKWDNLSEQEQMQVFQSQYGGSFLAKDTTSGKAIPKATIHLDMKRAGLNPENMTKERYNKFIDDWYKKYAPGSGSSKIIKARALKTNNFYQQRNCKK